MQDLKETVLFDPGFAPLSFLFSDAVEPIIEDLTKIKVLHQKKFRLTQYEPIIIKAINNCTAFYLGCILWGSYIHYNFTDAPREITGNHTLGLTKEEQEQIDFCIEADYVLKFIQRWDRDYKYFLKKPFKVDDSIIKILESYKEFVALNDNFKNTRTTEDIKLPAVVDHFKDFNKQDLANINNDIHTAICLKKIEALLEKGFYN